MLIAIKVALFFPPCIMLMLLTLDIKQLEVNCLFNAKLFKRIEHSGSR